MQNILEQRVLTLFHESIEAKMQIGETLAPHIVEASQKIVSALINGHKILTCGNGIGTAQAQIFTASLISRFKIERPSLPAIHIGSDLVSQSAIAEELSYNDVYSRPIRTLGHEGDVLVILNSSDDDANLLKAIEASHDKNMQVIALTGKNNAAISATLSPQDITLSTETDHHSRIHEIHLLTLFCLCDLIEEQLFGSHH